jgi:hypothetical protein
MLLPLGMFAASASLWLTPVHHAPPPPPAPVVHVAPAPPPPVSINHIAGIPDSFVSCVAYRESTDLQNPAANGNAYGIIPASGYNVAGDSLAQQQAVFRLIYNTSGPVAWAADGCPGT